MADLKVSVGDKCLRVKRQGAAVKPMAIATVRSASPRRIYMDYDPPIPNERQPGNVLREGHAGYNDVLNEAEARATFLCPDCGGEDCPNCACPECEGALCDECGRSSARPSSSSNSLDWRPANEPYDP